MNLNIGNFRKLKINIPSLEKQKKISSSLDPFNSLEQELEQRELQYRYYRKLLTTEPKKIYGKNTEIKEYTLGEVCEFKVGISLPVKDQMSEEIVDRNFIYHYLGDISKKILKGRSRCASVPNLYVSDLKKLKIYLPPLEIQKDIARILDKFFSSQSIIEELRELINLERKRYEYLRNKLTEDKLSDGIPVLGSKNIKNGLVVADKVSYCDSSKFPNANFFYPGEIAITVAGSIGEVGINQTSEKFFYTRGLVALEIKSSKVDTLFIYHYLRNYLKKFSEILKVGGVIPTLRLSELKALKVLLPSLEVQQEISKKLNTFQSLEKELEKELEKPKNLKVGGVIPGLRKSDLKSLKVKLPSLEIQTEIVEMLDKFSSKLGIIEALKKEMRMRGLQYECYRELMISSFNNLEN
ncbi:hypothetical protein PVNG_02339 [Plasmodium vivax North Korean]|uniref:Type I restriction modification DNA specificity domain-containing protein n=1 Tax=Plasmodium vivax North Korean TaxID=1035514 RepID=A0A0J9TM20_PLAVI|nr:hypothetical protein PVNG_02339 [Plasmodium vivax North Korean]